MELEHLILKTLYQKVAHVLSTEGFIVGSPPLHIREYDKFKIHFGTLVDILNNPKEYEKLNTREITRRIQTEEKVKIKKYQWYQVADAIEVLSYNEHIIDDYHTNKTEEGNTILMESERIIILTKKGAIDYRENFYIKKYLLRVEENRTSWKNRYWIISEILKYLIGGIVGALIALAITRINKSSDTQQASTIIEIKGKEFYSTKAPLPHHK